MKLKLQTLAAAGNHQFHYLTGKRKILNATLNVINFLQKFNCSIFRRKFFTKRLAL